MTASTTTAPAQRRAAPPVGREPTPAHRQPLPPQWIPASLRRSAGARAGQVVATQVAVALVAAAAGRGAALTGAAVLVAAPLLAGAWVRVRGRWLFTWLGVAAGHLSRRHALAAGAGPDALLALVSPGATVREAELAGGPAAVVDDAGGLIAVLEIGDPGDLLGDGPRALPAPSTLLPPASPELPPVRLQLLFTGSPAPAATAGGSTVATSYRQLTDGRLAGRDRALLAVRALRVDGWTDEDLRAALSGVVRRIMRRLRPVTVRPLGAPATLRVLADLAHHDDGEPVLESWPTVRTGPLLQTTFRVRRGPNVHTDGGRRLVPRLLVLPAAATTVSLCLGPRTGTDDADAPAELTVRVAAWTPGELSTAAQALRRLVDSAGGEVDRLDGQQLPALAGTLPLASAVPGAAVDAAVLAGLELPISAAGLVMGTNRHGGAVTIRLFRPEGTRLVLVGGVRAAQLVALRAMALGARVAVQTTRPRAWEPFVRGVGAPGGPIPVLPPGRPVGIPASPLRPLLLVVDAGPAPSAAGPEPAWQSTLVVRDDLTPADVEPLGRADLAVLQPLSPAEATLAGAALGLGGSAEWLTRIREDMVAVVNRRALRWALLSPTPIESQLIGRPGRG
ncbi:type VII secretion protein EccE [Micromonospora sp. RTGN7]|uniref:type VII secretion protein EccE n=1 Tax=Micromonospora sp. RTGN7 TaxID=3016526 RepID=UPI0029FEF3DE|nr:type VII secretion protein EccE [Micromonospora sp. RTGN7]